jgi:ubiquitin-like protein ATG12
MDEGATVTTPSSPPSPAKPSEEKVIVMFKSAGGAPALKKKKFFISGASSFQMIIDFLRKQLKLQPTDPLYLFVSDTFQPHPEETVADLFKCFQSGGQLIISYCYNVAWG